ncbi:MAG: hypothetical protein IJH04_00040 [Eggerthellaceae bacterium]|nr:hypothetical protein [Eggerthellaceae bacterium]
MFQHIEDAEVSCCSVRIGKLRDACPGWVCIFWWQHCCICVNAGVSYLERGSDCGEQGGYEHGGLIEYVCSVSCFECGNDERDGCIEYGCIEHGCIEHGCG